VVSNDIDLGRNRSLSDLPIATGGGYLSYNRVKRNLALPISSFERTLVKILNLNAHLRLLKFQLIIIS
jgi:hypothetical protein